MMGLLRIAVLVVLVTASVAAHADTVSVQCAGITSGDTILIQQGERVDKIVLLGIDSPEPGQPHFEEALRACSFLAFGKTLRIEFAGKDDQGNTMAAAFCGEVNIGNEMVRQGLAWWRREYAMDSVMLQALETQARASKIGIWSETKPVAPWNFKPLSRQATPIVLALGSTTEEVFLVLGSPDSIIVDGGKVVWKYGKSSITFQDNRIVDWSTIDRELRIVGTPPKPIAAQKPSVTQVQSPVAAMQMVYFTRNGQKFHRTGCRHLKGLVTAISRSEALARGLTPCAVCRP